MTNHLVLLQLIILLRHEKSSGRIVIKTNINNSHDLCFLIKKIDILKLRFFIKLLLQVYWMESNWVQWRLHFLNNDERHQFYDL